MLCVTYTYNFCYNDPFLRYFLVLWICFDDSLWVWLLSEVSSLEKWWSRSRAETAATYRCSYINNYTHDRWISLNMLKRKCSLFFVYTVMLLYCLVCFCFSLVARELAYISFPGKKCIRLFMSVEIVITIIITIFYWM